MRQVIGPKKQRRRAAQPAGQPSLHSSSRFKISRASGGAFTACRRRAACAAGQRPPPGCQTGRRPRGAGRVYSCCSGSPPQTGWCCTQGREREREAGGWVRTGAQTSQVKVDRWHWAFIRWYGGMQSKLHAPPRADPAACTACTAQQLTSCAARSGAASLRSGPGGAGRSRSTRHLPLRRSCRACQRLQAGQGKGARQRLRQARVEWSRQASQPAGQAGEK